jgi:hypothetical protein
VNRFGLAREATAGIPWLRLRYEDLFDADGAALRRLLRFLDLPPRDAARAALSERIDRQHFATWVRPVPVAAAAHPRIAEVAAALGYALDDASAWSGTARYFGGN